MAEQAAVETPIRGRRQTKTGIVTSSGMDKTVVVAVPVTVIIPLYRRYMKRTAKFYAHDESNECRNGDKVLIAATRPLSKKKRWRVKEILQRAEGS